MPYPLKGAQHVSEGIDWDILTFYDADYGGDTLHMSMWPEALEYLAIKWSKDPSVLKRYLNDSYTGLPRGRVGQEMLDGHIVYDLAHGNDLPPGCTVEHVINAFNLRVLKAAGRLRVFESQHETMDPGDMRRVRAALGGVDLGLKGQPVHTGAA